jgi:hypothetical protein
MARYEREYGARDRGYDRGYGARGGRGQARYDRSYGRAGYGEEYRGGWGMTNRYNTIMHGGPRGRERYGREFYRRPAGAPYRAEYDDRGRGSGRQGGGYTGQGFRRGPDHDSIGVHYGTPERRYDRGWR